MSAGLIIILCVVAFVAGFTDAVVGGGGLIQMPVMFIAFPSWMPITVVATNRFASASGTLVAAIQYARKIQINWKIVLITAACGGSAALGGAQLMQIISPQVFKPIVLAALIGVAIYTYTKKTFGITSDIPHEYNHGIIIPALIGIALGFYNGFIGPGTGTFIIFAFIGLLKYDFLRASASAKVINFFTDFSTLAYFAINNHVVYKIALPMAVCNIAGGYIGSHMAMLRGSKFVRVFFIIIVCAVIVRFAWDIFKN